MTLDTGNGRIATIGMFDGVHVGHHFLVEVLREEGEKRGLRPTVFTFDRHPATLVKGTTKPMLSSIDDRIAMLKKAGAEDVFVLQFDNRLRNMSARQFMEMLATQYQVRALILGFNNRFGHDRLEGIQQYRKIGNELGMEVIEAHEYNGKSPRASSSDVRCLLSKGLVEDAALVLGRPFVLKGSVVEGKHLGRTIGFPTANIKPSTPDIIIPATGVYAVFIRLSDHTLHHAMLNIGHRPTVDKAEAPITIEAHILEFKGDLYGQTVEVEFIARLRDEQRFPSLEQLQVRLSKDATLAHTVLSAYTRRQMK